jgi:hypothetical protein
MTIVDDTLPNNSACGEEAMLSLEIAYALP